MRTIALIAALMAASCHIEPAPSPRPTPIPAPAPAPNSYCGDGVCDEWRGEDAWWCVDCGYDPLTNGPRDGGYCGDGVCFGHESMWTCWKDCRPVPYNPEWDPFDPGYVDPPPPWRNPMVVKVIRTERTGAEDTWTIIGPDGPLASFAMPVGSEREDIEEAAWETVPEPQRVEEMLLKE